MSSLPRNLRKNASIFFPTWPLYSVRSPCRIARVKRPISPRSLSPRLSAAAAPSRRHLRRDDEQAGEKWEMPGWGGTSKRRVTVHYGTHRNSWYALFSMYVRIYVRHDAGFVTRSGFFEEPSANRGDSLSRWGRFACNTSGARSSTMILTPPPLSLSLSLGQQAEVMMTYSQ